MTSKDIIKIIPNPKKIFTSNTLNITFPINDNVFNYDHKGTYIASCSSYANDNCKAYNAFNWKEYTVLKSYWQCDYKGNKQIFNYKPYVTDSYNNSNVWYINSSYVGGGDKSNKWETTINNNQLIFGEWIQIQIPNPIKLYLYSYSIITPKSDIKGISTFPTKIMVLGSNDGKKWKYVDHKNINVYNSDITEKTFDINSINPYCYYRLVILEMPPGNKVIRIINWKLNFTTFLKINPEAFTNYQYSNNKLKYLNYKNSEPIDNKEITYNNISIDKIDENDDNDNFFPIIIISFLAISLIFYYNKNN
jgi:hypothetical protein